MSTFQSCNKFKPIWAYLSIFQPIWAYLSLFGPIWAYLGLFELIRVYLSLFQPIWAYLSLFEPSWGYLCIFEPIWAYLSLFEHVQNHVWASSNKIELECQANHQKERMIVICKVHQNFRLQMSYYLELKTTIFKVCSEASSHQIHQMLISTFVWFVVPKDIFCVLLHLRLLNYLDCKWCHCVEK